LRLPAVPRGIADFGLRVLRRFVDIEGPQLATVISAQAFTSLVPFVVVASAIGPGDEDLADRIIERFSLDGSAARSVRSLFAESGDVESAVTWVGGVILVLSALSFTRAIQRMFQRAYGEKPGGPKDMWRGLIWLGGFAVWITVSSPLREVFEDVGGLLAALVVSGAVGFVLWLWTPALLLASSDWRRLLPGAVVSAVLGTCLSIASGIYVPILMTWSADRYGLIGIAFSLQSFLLVVGFVAVIGAVVGAVTSEMYGDRIDRLARKRVREPAG
jgi:membrane protein